MNADFVEKEDTLIKAVKRQIDEYLQGKRKAFDIPIIMADSDFQKQVWTELLNVPYGKTASYLDLAKRIDNPKAVMAVASANGANALAVIIPCHKIIASDGELDGYGGGLNVKKQLLKLESANKYEVI